jgi:PGF-pre-PGF domain-containing protein
MVLYQKFISRMVIKYPIGWVFLDRKGLVGLAKFGAAAVAFAFMVTMSTVLLVNVNAATNNQLQAAAWSGTSLTSPNFNQTITLLVWHTNATAGGNITNVTIYLPGGFAFSGTNSNLTNTTLGTFVYVSATRSLNFSNTSTAIGTELAVFNRTYTGLFQFNVSTANYSGLFNFTIMVIDEAGVTNTTIVNIPNIVYPTIGKTQWSSCGDPDGSSVTRPLGCASPGTNNTQGFFFYDGNNVSVILNITDSSYRFPVKNLSVLFNFTGIGNSWAAYGPDNLIAAEYDATNGFYYAKGYVNFTNATTWTGGSIDNTMKNAMINIFIDTCNKSANSNCNVGVNTFNSSGGGGPNIFATAMLVNITTFGCPPADDARANAMFDGVTPFGLINATGRVAVSGCLNYNYDPINATYNLANSKALFYAAAFNNTAMGYMPVVWNGTAYKIVSPNFGSLTTNLSDDARTMKNFSNLTLTLDIPGQGRITFDSNTNNGVNFASPNSMGGLMDFAIKSLVSRGRIGVNESEYNGLNTSGRARPNLTMSATLYIYNATGVFGYSHARPPAIKYGTYNGTNAPTNTIPCNSTKCSSVAFDGENISFTVSSWSTYLIGDANFTLQFNGTNKNNISAQRAAYLPVNTTTTTHPNLTFTINITNLGNTLGEYYNITFAGLPQCNTTGVLGGSWFFVNNGLSSGCLRFNNSFAVVKNGTIIYLAQGASAVIDVNFTANNTPGTYTFGIAAQRINETNITQTLWNLNSTNDGMTWTVVLGEFTINSPVNRSNITTIANNISIYFSNFSALHTINWTAYNNTNAGSRTYLNTTPSSPLFIGFRNFSESNSSQLQNITIWWNDTLGNANVTTLAFVVDNSIPYMYNNSYNTNNSNMTDAALYLTTNESISGTHSVWISLKNSTTFYATANLSTYSYANFNATEWANTTFNSTYYPDGLYNLTFWSRGWNDQVNNSITKWVWIDNNAPNISLSTSASAIGAGSTITITCGATDYGYGVANQTLTVAKPVGGSVSATCGSSFTDTSTVGLYTVTYSATDYRGRTTSTSVTFTSTSGGGSSGTGGSGGAGTTTSEMTDSFTVSAIAAGAAHTFTITKDIDITQVEVTPTSAASSVGLTVSKYTGKPADVSTAPSGTVFSYLSIAASNLDNSNIQAATVRFRVLRTWITSNNIDVSTIRLNRYVSGAWSVLQTTQTGADANYIYFSATTAGFSYFAITALPAPSPGAGAAVTCNAGEKRCTGNSLEECLNNNWILSDSCAEGCNSTSLACNQAAAGTAAPPVIDAGIWMWVVAVVIIVIIIGLLYFFLAK